MKLLFTDLDETLLDTHKNVPPQNREAIRKAIAAGHKVILTTGRPSASSLPLAKELGLDLPGCYLICYNGGRIYDFDHDETILDRRVALPYVRHMFDACKAAGLHVHAYDESGVVTPAYNEEAASYIRWNSIPYRVDPGLPDSLQEEPGKLMIMHLTDRDRLEAFRASQEAWAHGKVSLFFSAPFYLECVPEGVSKGAAIRFLAERLGVPLDETVAVGDSENDIPMLETAGFGCAMKNGTDGCKAVAEYITERDCSAGGFAEVVEKFVL